MKKTSWFLTMANALVALLLGFANYTARETAAGMPRWLASFANAFEPDPLRWVLLLTSVGVLIPLIDRYLGGYELEKARTQRVLDQLVDDVFDGHAKDHRCSLFRAVRGWRAWVTALSRLPWQDDRWWKFLNLMQIRPWGLYLYVWVRPKRAKNPRSAAVYRIYRHRDRDCEGVAGLVWRKDTYTIRNLPVINPGSPREIRKLSEYAVDDPIREYAELTNAGTASLLRAREHYSRHFHGTVIENSSGDKWGVLLMDSMASDCPIPDIHTSSTKKKHFDEAFRRYAGILGAILT